MGSTADTKQSGAVPFADVVLARHRGPHFEDQAVEVYRLCFLRLSVVVVIAKDVPNDIRCCFFDAHRPITILPPGSLTIFICLPCTG